MNIINFYVNITLVTITIFISSVLFITLVSKWNKIFVDPKPKKYPSITIAVPAHNEEKSIATTLKHLLKLNYPNKVNIIVVDDGSKDKTVQIVKKFPVKLISKKKNQGKAKALNDALKITKTEIFGFIDAETFIDKNAVKNLIGYFNDKKVGAVMPLVYVNKPKSMLEKLQQIEYVFTMMSRKILTFLNCLFVTPGCAFYRTSIVKKIGGFDEKTITEDLEMGLKLNKHGYLVESSINAKVWTVVPKKIKDLVNQRIRWYRGTFENMVKYKHLFFKKSDIGIFVMPFILLGGLLTIFLYSILLGLLLLDFIYNIIIYSTGFILSDFTIVNNIVFEPNLFLVFTVFLLGMFGMNIYFSEKITGISLVRGIKELLLFLTVYSVLLSISLIISIIKIITRSEKKW